jgi:hypothetical protein
MVTKQLMVFEPENLLKLLEQLESKWLWKPMALARNQAALVW